MIGIGAYGLFRLVVEFLPVTFSELAIWFHIWGLVTMIYGGAMALMQDDLKRFLAYSSISQMGYLLFGIGSMSAGYSDACISANSKLPSGRPIIKNPNNKTTAPA